MAAVNFDLPRKVPHCFLKILIQLEVRLSESLAAETFEILTAPPAAKAWPGSKAPEIAIILRRVRPESHPNKETP